MSLNYDFINNVSQPVRDEIQRRENVYWPTGYINNEALSWNYQKTAWITMRAIDITTTPGTALTISTMINPTAPILDLYNDKGTIKGAVINSAEISSDGTYGSILRTTVNFTVFDRFELDAYIDNFLRPGREIELKYGWLINDNLNVNTGTHHATVYNFNFSAKSDGSWDCTLNALGPSTMTYGFGADQKGTEKAEEEEDYIVSPKGKSLAEIFSTIVDTQDSDIGTDISITANCNKRNITASYKILNSTLNDNIEGFNEIYSYIFNLPLIKKDNGKWVLQATASDAIAAEEETDDYDDAIKSAQARLDLLEGNNAVDTGTSGGTVAGNILQDPVYRQLNAELDLLQEQRNASNDVALNTVLMNQIALKKVDIANREIAIKQEFNTNLSKLKAELKRLEALKAGNETKAEKAKTSSTTAVAPARVSYMTLGDLVKLINLIITKSTKIYIPTYTFNGFDANGNKDTDNLCRAKLNLFFKGVGPSDFNKFIFATQINGAGTPNLNFNIGNSFDPPISRDSDSTENLSNLILFNVEYMYNSIQKILSNETNLTGKKIVSFLSNLFNEINTTTGGWISLIVKDSPQDPNTHKSMYIQILNENYAPTKSELNLQPPLMFKAFTKGSIVRNLSVEASVPDAIQTEVATYTRAGESYVGSGDSVNDADDSLQKIRASLFKSNIEFMKNFNLESDEDTKTSSLAKWQSDIQGMYRKMFAITQGHTLAGNIVSKYNIGTLGTAIFPIRLKVTLDGIEGFQYGNSITSNWLPKQYMIDNVYWTVIKIRHVIQNNDWSTELETIYRINI